MCVSNSEYEMQSFPDVIRLNKEIDHVEFIEIDKRGQEESVVLKRKDKVAEHKFGMESGDVEGRYSVKFMWL